MSHSGYGAHETNSPTREDLDKDLSRKDVYEKLLKIVEYQTGGPDQQLPAGCSGSTLYLFLIDYDDVTKKQAKRARRAAIQNGDILKWTGPEGRDRYTRHSEEGLRDLVAEEAQRDNPDRSRIAKCNELLANMEGSE